MSRFSGKCDVYDWLEKLPDKHGRLIDADEIPWNHGANGDVVVYPDTIAEMPTIVEAEGDE